MVDATDSIHSDPEIMGGTPVFVGTRVPVKNLFDYLAGSGLREFLSQFPSVKPEQALAVIHRRERRWITMRVLIDECRAP